MNIKTSMLKLGAISPDPLDELDSDLHHINHCLLSIAQRDSYSDLIRISHPRSQRALQRMPVGEVQRIAPSTLSIFTFTTCIESLIDNMPILSVDDEIDALERAHAGFEVRIIEQTLLTFRQVANHTPEPLSGFAGIKTGLTRNGCDALADMPISSVRLLAEKIMNAGTEDRPALRLRYPERMLCDVSEDFLSRQVTEITDRYFQSTMGMNNE